MFYRVTKINVNEGHMEDVVNYLNSVSNRMEEIEGLQTINIIKINETEAYGFSCYKTEDQAINAAVIQKEILGGMAKFFSAPPELMTGPQMWHWNSNEVTI
tara:strand:+ start:108 stop:410 length:303 start_codon:yes stop_codon:yes gene_type:complete